MKKNRLLPVLVLASAFLISSCGVTVSPAKTSGGNPTSNTSQPSGGTSGTSGATGSSGASGSSGSSGSTSGATSGGSSGGSASSGTTDSGSSSGGGGSASGTTINVKTDWYEEEKTLMRQYLDGEVLPFLGARWSVSVDQSSIFAAVKGGDEEYAAAQEAFSNWRHYSAASFEIDSANGEVQAALSQEGSWVTVEASYVVGWTLSEKALMRELLDGYVVPYYSAYASIEWSNDNGSLRGQIASSAFGYMAFYNFTQQMGGIYLMDTNFGENDATLFYSTFASNGSYDIVSYDDGTTHSILVTFTAVQEDWTSEQRALMATFMPEEFPFVGAANWDISENDSVGGYQFRAPLAQVDPNTVFMGDNNVLSNGYRYVTGSGSYYYFEKVLENKTLIDCFVTYNAVYLFIIVYPANVPTSEAWSTTNQTYMNEAFGEVLPFPGESWYECEYENHEISIRGVELDAEKAAAIATFFEGEGYDVGVDPTDENSYLMCKSNGAGKYINLKLRRSTLRLTYYLEGSLEDEPNIDRVTFVVSSSSEEIELGDTFTVSVSRGNFVAGEVEFEVSNEAAVEVVEAGEDSVTYRVIDLDPSFTVTAKIGDGSEFSDSVTVALVAVTWSAAYKALMRENFNGRTLPYAEEIKDMAWSVSEGHVVGSIPTEIANLAAVLAVYNDAGSGYDYVGESDGVHTYQAIESVGAVQFTYIVAISEVEDVVYVVASFTKSWSAAALYYMNAILDSALPFFEIKSFGLSGGGTTLVLGIESGEEAQAAVSQVFVDAGWTDWGTDSGYRWFYKYSNYGRIVALIGATGSVYAYVYQPYADYTEAQQTTMTDALDGVVLPSIPGIQITVQTNAYGGILAYGFSNADNAYSYFLTEFYNEGYSLYNGGSYYFVVNHSDHGAIIAYVSTGDAGSGYVYLQVNAYYIAEVSAWSDDDTALMTSVLGEALPAVVGCWDSWYQESETELSVEGYYIDVDALVAAFVAESYVYDADNGTLTKDLGGGNSIVVTLDVTDGGVIVDLTVDYVAAE